MNSNLALAKALADFADALADYNHLPPLTVAAVSVEGTVFARVSSLVPDAVSVRHVATWADTFSVPVKVNPAVGHDYATLTADVEIAGRRVEVATLVGLSTIRELAGDSVSVAGTELIAALDSEAVA
jgi:hypothetical protein